MQEKQEFNLLIWCEKCNGYRILEKLESVCSECGQTNAHTSWCAECKTIVNSWSWPTHH